MMFIHGESYDWGSGNPYDGSVLASYTDQVVVTINYRLGVLGFLNANTIRHSKARVANYGLMDQIAALQWVQENIALFGGDPGNVTLMGQGTGAACVNFLAISPTVMAGECKINNTLRFKIRIYLVVINPLWAKSLSRWRKSFSSTARYLTVSKYIKTYDSKIYDF